MSLEELWQLFPIFLTEYQPVWKAWYVEEEAFLKKSVPQIERISHIGSTALASIHAKPIVDILVEVPAECDLLNCRQSLLDCGYTYMGHSSDGLSFNKGYTEKGFAERVFHLHLRHTGDNNELYFRDYLLEHPEVAAAYEELKLALWKKYEHNRDGYTNAKTEFIQAYTEKAKLQYRNRY